MSTLDRSRNRPMFKIRGLHASTRPEIVVRPGKAGAQAMQWVQSLICLPAPSIIGSSIREVKTSSSRFETSRRLTLRYQDFQANSMYFCQRRKADPRGELKAPAGEGDAFDPTNLDMDPCFSPFSQPARAALQKSGIQRDRMVATLSWLLTCLLRKHSLHCFLQHGPRGRPETVSCFFLWNS